ncbi:hypothetical protein LZ32DRAFT_405979 [Colletotrichum eremochloae]|nr:hypothetical protein LZ32DRAFT_405979 [Colletotrichum eremochloae]
MSLCISSGRECRATAHSGRRTYLYFLFFCFAGPLIRTIGSHEAHVRDPRARLPGGKAYISSFCPNCFQNRRKLGTCFQQGQRSVLVVGECVTMRLKRGGEAVSRRRRDNPPSRVDESCRICRDITK